MLEKYAKKFRTKVGSNLRTMLLNAKNVRTKVCSNKSFFLTNVAALVFCLVHGTHDNKTRFYLKTAFLKINQGTLAEGKCSVPLTSSL